MALRETRPRPITLFARIYWLSVALSVANILTRYAALRAYAISQGTAAAGPAIAILIALLSGLLFWFFIVRRASNVAKWLLVVLSALSLIQMPQIVSYSRTFGWVYGLTFAASGVALFGAIILLFRADSIAWLTDREARSVVDHGVFD